MSKKLLFATIASVLATGAFADPKTVTTQDYVDNQDDAIYEYVDDELANKQDLIEEYPYTWSYGSPELVSNDGEDGMKYGKITIFDNNFYSQFSDEYGMWPDGEFYNSLHMEEGSDVFESTVPTLGVVGAGLKHLDRETWKNRIPGTGYARNKYGEEYAISDYTANSAKGAGLVATTNDCSDGGSINYADRCATGERLIFEEGTTYSGTTAQKIQIPTIGAVMAAISNNQVTLPTGTANSIVMYNANGNIGGSRTIATSVGTNTSATTIPTTGAVVTGLNTKQNKMTCTRYVENAEQTDANCLLWSIN